MSTNAWRNLLGAAAIGLGLGTAALPAHAELVTFEDVSPILFQGGSPTESVTSGRFTFTSDGFGFSGVDTAAAFSIFGNAPANAMGKFLFALNTDGITMKRSDASLFFLDRFDASFIAPAGGLGPNLLAGELHVLGLNSMGDVVTDIFEFEASDASGNFNFKTFGSGAFLGMAVSEVFFVSCIYLSTGSCDFAGANVLPQFALDNIEVPEPATLALVGLALGAAGVAARRRSARSV